MALGRPNCCCRLILTSSTFHRIGPPPESFSSGLSFRRSRLSTSGPSPCRIRKRPYTSTTGFPMFRPKSHPMDDYIAFATNESGTYQIIVQTFPDSTRERVPVTAQGGTEPFWKGDGRELYYLAPDGKIMAVPVKSDPTFQVGQPSELFQTTLTPQVPPLSRRYAVSPDGQRFLLASGSNAQTNRTSIPITAVVNWTAT